MAPACRFERLTPRAFSDRSRLSAALVLTTLNIEALNLIIDNPLPNALHLTRKGGPMHTVE